MPHCVLHQLNNQHHKQQNMSNSATASVTAVINMLPIGTILPYMGTTDSLAGLPAQGWLLCNGEKLSTKDYMPLYQVIKNAFGGDAGTFYLPDLRGMFLRGVNSGTGNDPDARSRTAQNPGGNTGDAVGSRQPDAFQLHSHTYDHWISTNFQLTASGNQWNPPHDFVKGGATSNAGGNETRPKNVYTWYIIFAGVPGGK
jgi:microcystin-dependent protein